MRVEHAADHCSEPGCSWSVEGAGYRAAAHVERQLREHISLVHTSPLRLNLGAGDDRRPGFISVDLRADVADVVAPVDDLPYETGAVDELLALDILEHHWRDAVPAVLAEWRRVLRPGGRLTVRVPNLLVLADQLLFATKQHKDLVIDKTIENIYGGHRWGPGGLWDTHHWGYVPTSLEGALNRAGFVVLSNDNRANMTVICERGSA